MHKGPPVAGAPSSRRATHRHRADSLLFSGRVTAGTVCHTMEVSWSSTVQFEVYIDPDRCGKSRVCIDMCSMGVFREMDGTVLPYNSNLCCSCFKCNEFCPHHAISTRWILRA